MSRLYIRSYKDTWNDDKARLKAGNKHIDIDWDGETPDDNDAAKIVLGVQDLIMNPTDPVELNRDYLNDLVNKLRPAVESVMGSQFTDVPTIQAVDISDYFQNIKKLVSEQSRLVGNRFELMSPPTIGYFPVRHTILLPSSYIMRTPKGAETGLESDNFTIEYFPWQKECLEVLLASNMICALFREQRGEIYGDFAYSLTSVEKKTVTMIDLLKDAITQLSIERIAETSPELNLAVLKEKISAVWTSRAGMMNYQAAEAWSNKVGLGTVGMLDGIYMPAEDRALIIFDDRHPYHSHKKKVFEEALPQ